MLLLGQFFGVGARINTIRKAKEKAQKGKGTTPPHKCAPIWMRAGEFRLAPCWREWALHRLGVTPQQIRVDLFSKHGEGACALSIDRAQNAFSFDWADLCKGGDDYLWANPPFQALPRVLAKISQEPCRVILVCPVWEEEKWWDLVQKMTSNRVYLPQRKNLYYGAVKVDMLPPPQWRTMVCVVDSTGGGFPPPSPRMTKVLQQEAKHYGMDHLRRILGFTSTCDGASSSTSLPLGQPMAMVNVLGVETKDIPLYEAHMRILVKIRIPGGGG